MNSQSAKLIKKGNCSHQLALVMAVITMAGSLLWPIFPVVATTLQSAATTSSPAKYQLLEPDVIGGAQPANLSDYFNLMYNAILTVIVILAIYRIVRGALEYMFSNVPGSKADGKDVIKGALFGLLIALTSWLILHTINPNLVDWKCNKFLNLNVATDSSCSVTLPS
ncbi:MAG: hypothetical protein AAB645_02125 [Patescibacteria group bacterium]